MRDSVMTGARTSGRVSAVLVIAVAAVVTSSAAARPPDFVGKRLFRTPSNAAFCAMPRTLEPANPVVLCWTPNDGFTASIQHARGFKGRASSAAVGYRGWEPPLYPLLPFGEDFVWRCRRVNPSFATSCSRRYGKTVFVCRSRSSGLTCRNRWGQGFWLGRFVGYRVF